MIRLFVAAIFLALPSHAEARCDGIADEAAQSARAALSTGDVGQVLMWVGPGDQEAIRGSLARAEAVARLSPAALELAQDFLVDELIRLRCAAETEAVVDPGPLLAAADRALHTGSTANVMAMVKTAFESGMRARLELLKTASEKMGPGDLEARHRYLEAYAGFVSYVEAVFEAAGQPVEGSPASPGKGAKDDLDRQDR